MALAMPQAMERSPATPTISARLPVRNPILSSPQRLLRSSCYVPCRRRPAAGQPVLRPSKFSRYSSGISRLREGGAAERCERQESAKILLLMIIHAFLCVLRVFAANNHTYLIGTS